jgi:hypothetical protein
MSRRTSNTSKTVNVKELQKELADLKSAAIETAAADSLAQEGVAGQVPSFDSLTRTEQAAASLGVSPESWKPISFLNNGHYQSLLNNNALDDTLARRIEVPHLQ